MATLLLLSAFGAISTDLPPSTLRLTVTAVVGVLAPLFWPGLAATPTRTLLRVAAWSAAAACLAGAAIRVLGNALQPLPRIVEACLMLALVLFFTHALAAAFERRWRGWSADEHGAREMAGRMSAIALVLLGALPLWLGPVAELLAARHAWVIDAVVGVSPLTHLAVASGNDLMRNEWLYHHSNLAALPFSYPSLAELTWFYAAACLLAALCVARLSNARRRPDPNFPHPPENNR